MAHGTDGSTHKQPHAHDDHDNDHAAGGEDGDDLPVHGPKLAEPKTPMWLPAIGAVIASLVMIAWLSSPGDAAKIAATSASASASTSASAAAPMAVLSAKPGARP